MGRIPYATEADIDEEFHEYLFSTLQPGKAVNVYAGLGNNPAVLKGFRQFLGSIWSDSGLTERQREIVILTTANEIDSSYEWHQHVNIGKRIGMSEATIGAISRDDRAPFSPEEGALIAYTRAVVRGRVQDPVHDSLAEYFDEKTIVGIAAIAAGYEALGRMIDAFQIDLEAGDSFVGWEP